MDHVPDTAEFVAPGLVRIVGVHADDGNLRAVC